MTLREYVLTSPERPAGVVTSRFHDVIKSQLLICNSGRGLTFRDPDCSWKKGIEGKPGWNGGSNEVQCTISQYISLNYLYVLRKCLYVLTYYATCTNTHRCCWVKHDPPPSNHSCLSRLQSRSLRVELFRVMNYEWQHCSRKRRLVYCSQCTMLRYTTMWHTPPWRHSVYARQVCSV